MFLQLPAKTVFHGLRQPSGVEKVLRGWGIGVSDVTEREVMGCLTQTYVMDVGQDFPKGFATIGSR